MERSQVSASDLKVADLKKELEKRGLSKSGNKAQLIERLQKGLEKEGQTLDSIFGAQVDAQKCNSAISGLDMARWCSQIAKPAGAPSDNASNPAESPVVSPTPPVPQQRSPQFVAQNTPQNMQASPPQVANNTNGIHAHLSPMQAAPAIHQSPQPIHTSPSQQQLASPPRQQVAASQQQITPPQTAPLQIQPVVQQSPPQVVRAQQASPVKQPAVAQPIVHKAAPKVPTPPPVPAPQQEPAYSDLLVSDSDAKGFNSPLSVHDHDRMSDDDLDGRHTNKNNNIKTSKPPVQAEKVEENPPKPASPIIDPAMLIPRHQLQVTLKRLAARQEGQRKRKWSEEVANQPSIKNVVISDDLIKQLNLPEVSDVEEEIAEQINEPRRRRIVTSIEAEKNGHDEDGNMMDTLELTVEEKNDDLLGGDEVGSEAKKAKTTQQPVSRKPSVPSAPIALDVDAPRRAKREVSPARSAPTNILHVENLVRPFSLGQLKELLNRVGAVDESLFWTDKVKSHCIVGYKTVDDAIKTREALHGTQWPSTNPKILSVDFVTAEVLEKYKSMEEGSTRLVSAAIGAVRMALGGRQPRLVKGSVTSENGEAAVEERGSRLFKTALHGKDNESALRRMVKTVDNSNHDGDNGVPLRDRQGNNDSKRKDRDIERRNSGEGARQKASTEQEEKPVISLAELFKKTKAVPHLYWLPLNEEEMVKRDANRKERDSRLNQEREAREREREQREQREKEREREREQREKERIERERAERERQRQRQADNRRDNDNRGRRPSPDRGARRTSPARPPVTPPPFRSRPSRSRSASRSRSRSVSRSRSRSASSSRRSRSSSRSSSARSSASSRSRSRGRDRR